MATDDRSLVILDLDNTCICAVEMDKLHEIPHPNDFRNVDLEDIYRIYERPGLQEWLTSLFKTYKVGVWTAAGQSYGLFVINHFIINGHKERELEFFMWDDHCDYSHRRTKGQAKQVSLLEPLFSTKKMVLLDDNEDVLRQKTDTIDSKFFNVVHPKAKHDSFLKDMVDEEIKTHFDKKSEHKMMLRDEIKRKLEAEQI